MGLLVHSILRNRRRTLLTVSSIAVSLFLIGTLLALLAELEHPAETPDAALRLVTRHRMSLANILPAAHRAQISRLPGVNAVTGNMWFAGVYKDPKNSFAQFAIDADQFFRVMADVKIPDEQEEAFCQDRAGAIAGNNLASRFGWRVGDRVFLKGTVFSVDLELTIRGIYTGGSDDGGTLYFHWGYFNERMRKNFGPGYDFTGFYTIRVESAEHAPSVARAVDALFMNSTAPTKTQSENAFLLGFFSLMGNIRLLVTGICSVVIFAIILVAANTMAMSIRERVREIGVLKALGFRSSQILWLLLGESVALSVGGALLGVLAAKALYTRVRLAGITSGFIQSLEVTTETIVFCAAIGFFVGIVSAGIPAWNAARRRVIDALRQTV